MESQLYETLKQLGISDYVVHEHAALFHSDEAEGLGVVFEGLTLKNLFLRQKKSDHYYLVLTDYMNHVDLKHMKQVADWGKVRFGNEEELMEILGVTPGSVTPYALLHDPHHKVTVVLTKDIVDLGDDELINGHPCRNTATLSMKKSDFMKFLQFTGHELICETNGE